MKNPISKGIALAAGTLALVAVSANGSTVQTWNFGNNGDGSAEAAWTVTAGHFGATGTAGNGIEPAQANGTRAHDAAHPVAILTSPTINFGSVHASDSVIDILWEGGQGNQQASPDPANLAEVVGYNGGNTNNTGQKGIGFRNLTTGAYDLVDYDPQDGGGIQTGSYTLADLTAAGIDVGAIWKPVGDHRCRHRIGGCKDQGFQKTQVVRVEISHIAFRLFSFALYSFALYSFAWGPDIDRIEQPVLAQAQFSVLGQLQRRRQGR